MKLNLTLNGEARTLDAQPGEMLLELLRRNNCWSVKNGCQDGNCGTCVVQVNGEAVNACLMMAGQVQGAEILTCEGIGNPRAPHPIQSHFVTAAAVQCGYCTPGLIMSTKALLDRVSAPSDVEIKEALDGNLCRCTGYVKIMDAVHGAIEELSGQEATT